MIILNFSPFRFGSALNLKDVRANCFLCILNNHRVENVMKQLVHVSAVRSSRHEALGSPNFPRASYFDERTLTHESIVN